MEERIGALDWSRTSIGPCENWSQALRTTVRILVANRFPMLLWWGPDYISIYNDAYIPILGNKHPWAGCGKSGHRRIFQETVKLRRIPEAGFAGQGRVGIVTKWGNACW
jgi:hypothetical protein